MGLDAYVYCNCLKEGKTTNPPVARELIYVDDNGFLEILYPAGMKEKEKDRLHYKLREWSRDCCRHQLLHYCSERVGNWSAVSHLQEAVMEQASRFPVLASIWPSCNGGKVEARLAPQILEELEGFCLDIGKQTGLFLSDVRTGDDIYSFIKSNGGVFHFDGRIKRNTGFDQDGLFVVDRETGQEYFRSKHFTQKPLPEEKALRLDGKPYTIQPALLTDIGSGKECRVESLIGGYEEYSELAVVARHLKEDDFYSIEPLRNLLKASIETGNPVFWT